MTDEEPVRRMKPSILLLTNEAPPVIEPFITFSLKVEEFETSILPVMTFEVKDAVFADTASPVTPVIVLDENVQLGESSRTALVYPVLIMSHDRSTPPPCMVLPLISEGEPVTIPSILLLEMVDMEPVRIA